MIPDWNGNEFLLPDGSRPVIRTLTPFRADPAAGELDVCVVLHGSGMASTWAEHAGAGPARSRCPDRAAATRSTASAREFLLAGDETALPALTQVLRALPAAATVEVHVEAAGCVRFHPDAAPPEGDGPVARARRRRAAR